MFCIQCFPTEVEQWFRVAGEGYDLVDKARLGNVCGRKFAEDNPRFEF